MAGREKLDAFFNPASVALVGVPRSTGRGSYNVLENLLRFGYKGKVYPVNPKGGSVLGFRLYPNLESLPEVPDLAVVAVGRDRVLDIIRDCGRKGISRVIVVSQGFADADEKGARLQRELEVLAHSMGIRVVGPNTLGVVNHFAPFSTSFVDIRRDNTPWPVSVVCQSGIFHAGPESFTGKVGKGIDIGNACDVDFAECLEYFANDPQTRVIVIHMEGVRNGRKFLQVAGRVSREKPVLVIKPGRSEIGSRMALSHTGSMVGEYQVYKAAFRKAGLLDVNDPDELMDAVKSFILLPLMEGNRLGLISFTGAGAIMMADACESYGMEVASLSDRELKPLQELAPPWFGVSNPIDIWPSIMWGGYEKAMDTALKLLLESNQVDGVVIISGVFESSLHADLDPVERLKNRPCQETKPVAAWLYGDGVCEAAEKLERETNVAVYPSVFRAVRALSFLHKYHSFKTRNRTPVSEIPQFEGREEVLLGDRALGLLEKHGFPVVPYRLVKGEEDALEVAGELGYPLALKLISSGALHKTDVGGVVLGIKGASELVEAIRGVRGRVLEMGIPVEGFLLQPMVEGVELIMGVKRDSQFGPVITFGLGGIYTEVWRDFTLEIAPLNEDEALGMIEGIRGRAILEGVRGSWKVDKTSLVRSLLALSELVMEEPGVRELDINPVMANEERCLAVDCRVVMG